MTATFPLFLLACAQSALAATHSHKPSYHSDPILDYRPEFARSLPVQILLTGVVLTLVAVLFIHLLFTGQYHWPLAPINYVLQMAGVTTLLISLIATLHVVLSTTINESQRWPYMLNYIAVNARGNVVQPQAGSTGWSMAEKTTWMIMTATTSVLIQITHIHFLTLLFPSRLEARLIIFLLGPLALVAAVVQLLPITNDEKVIYVASAIKNVCNATLSLLFTSALFIWGVLINRKTAWRTDGGTAVFGAAALSLAVVSTALNLLYINRREEFLWMPSLIWAVILWQSFLGWWWWVGAGSGTSTDDRGSILQREEKNERKRREARLRRKNTKEKAKTILRAATDAFSTPMSLRRRNTVAPSSSRSSPQLTEEFVVAMDQSSSSSPPQAEGTTTSESDTSISTLPSFLPISVHRWYASLRAAHVTAARQQAQERAERIREMERESEGPHNSSGWGLGSFGLRVGTSEAEASRSRSRTQRGRSGSPVPREPTENELGETIIEMRRSSSLRRSRTPSLPPAEHVEMNNMSSDGRASGVEPDQAEEPQRPRSLFWWGPLGRWRLRDSTAY
ncbi:hypothetical protein DL96DRAFT_1600871 [Flagelloscypha sp. PMI_526]|nr:hypothetical protein DL96DRAFT_1600871 [Flagelloscypha sp. PMI_526]